MSNSAADGVSWTAALDGLVAETAAGRLLPGVHRCLLRVQTPRWPESWTAAATTHRDDRGGLDAEVAFRIASVTKMMTATALLVLADQGHCRLDDPTGRYLPSDLVDRFCDSTGRPYGAAITLRQLLDHTSGLPNFFSQPPILDAVQHAAVGGGSRRSTSSTWRWPASRRPRRQARPAPTPTPASCSPGSSSKRWPAGRCRKPTGSWCWIRPAWPTPGWRAATSHPAAVTSPPTT